MKARVSNLYRTEAEWNKVNFIPYEGEFVIYAPDAVYSYARLKVGDGKTILQQLPFFTDVNIDEKLADYRQASVCDAGRITSYF